MSGCFIRWGCSSLHTNFTKKYQPSKSVSKFPNRSRNVLEWKYWCLRIDMELQVVIELQLSFEIDSFEDNYRWNCDFHRKSIQRQHKISIENSYGDQGVKSCSSSNESISKLRWSSMATCSSISMRKYPYFHSSTFLDRLGNFRKVFWRLVLFFVNMQRNPPNTSPPDETAWPIPNSWGICIFQDRYNYLISFMIG